MTEFGSIGSHCHYERCHQLDWLPFDCDLCKHKFCLAHRTTDSHECAVAQQQQQQHQEMMSHRANRVRQLNVNPYKCDCCNQRSLQENVCRSCKHNYCLKHRFAGDHDCKPISVAELRFSVMSIAAASKTAATATAAAAAALTCAQQQNQAASSSSSAGKIRHTSNIASMSRLLQQQTPETGKAR